MLDVLGAYGQPGRDCLRGRAEGRETLPQITGRKHRRGRLKFYTAFSILTSETLSLETAMNYDHRQRAVVQKHAHRQT